MYKYTDKKEKKIFLIYKEIQMGSGTKSYISNTVKKVDGKLRQPDRM
jgi:hypothetical protein